MFMLEVNRVFNGRPKDLITPLINAGGIVYFPEDIYPESFKTLLPWSESHNWLLFPSGGFVSVSSLYSNGIVNTQIRIAWAVIDVSTRSVVRSAICASTLANGARTVATIGQYNSGGSTPWMFLTYTPNPEEPNNIYTIGSVDFKTQHLLIYLPDFNGKDANSDPNTDFCYISAPSSAATVLGV